MALGNILTCGDILLIKSYDYAYENVYQLMSFSKVKMVVEIRSWLELFEIYMKNLYEIFYGRMYLN